MEAISARLMFQAIIIFAAMALFRPTEDHIPSYMRLKKYIRTSNSDAWTYRPVNSKSKTVLIFTNLEKFDFEYSIEENGVPVKTEKLAGINGLPGESKVVTIDFSKLEYKPGCEYFITLRALQKAAEPMIPLGHIVAYEQFVIARGATTTVEQYSEAALSFSRTPTGIAITGNGFSMAFDSLGRLSSYVLDNKEYLKSALQPNFWRAPNDNDYGNGMQNRCRIWKDAADHLKLIKLEVKQLAPEMIELIALYDIPAVKGTWEAKYLIQSAGQVRVKNMFTTSDRSLPEIPRIGMRMKLIPEMNNMAYFGRGPWENYIDRNTSALVSLYHGKVNEQTSLYLRPQENNYHTDVRWFKLTDDTGRGIVVSGLPTFSTSALNNAMEDFDDGEKKDQRHITNIVPHDFVEWCIDYKQMGVGGDDSWGARPLPKYQIVPGEYYYEFVMKPVR